MEERKILINNHIINFQHKKLEKSSCTLVFIHGWGSCIEVWNKISQQLNSDIDILLIDLPGFGKSADLKKTFSTKDFVNIVHELLARLDIKNYVLVGHSFGGQIILHGVIHHDLDPKGIVLINSAGIRKKNICQKMLKLSSKILLKHILTNKIKEWIYRHILKSEDYVSAKKDTNLKNTFLKITNEDISNMLDNINTNALIIWGNKDNITPLSHGKLMHSQIRNSKLHVLDGDHFIPINKASEISQIIFDWLKQIL